MERRRRAPLGRCVAPDVDFVNIYGAYRNGRENVESSHKMIFNGIYKDSHNEFTIEKVREPRTEPPYAAGVYPACSQERRA